MKLSKDFSRQEFDCKDGTIVPDEYMDNCQELVNNLQILRDYLGVAVNVTGSGYRTPSHNKKVTKNPFSKSQHLTCSAADINAEGYTPNELHRVIEKLIIDGKIKQGGLGLYRNFVHYDIRGKKARW